MIEGENLNNKAEEALDDLVKKGVNIDCKIFDVLPIMAYLVSMEGKIIQINQKVVELLNYESKSDLIGKDIFEMVYHPQYRPKAISLFEKWKRTGQLRNEEMKVITRGMNSKDVLLNVDTLYDNNGEVICSMSTHIDISELKVAQQKLRDRSERKYHKLFDGSNDALIIHDLDGRIIDVNRKAVELFGFLKSDAVDMKIGDLYSDDSMDDLKKAMRLTGDRGSVKYESVMETRDGRRLPVEISSAIVDSEEGIVQKMVQDISERKNAEYSLMMRFMRFVLEDGNIYYSAEDGKKTGREAFRDLVELGYSGLIVTRSKQDGYMSYRTKKVRSYHLSIMKGEWNIEPDPDQIKRMISELRPRSVVLFERLDYLILRSDQEKVLRFIQDIGDIAFINKIIIIISIDLDLSNDPVVDMIRKEARSIIPMKSGKMTSERLEMIKFVYNRNLIGLEPNYGEIHNELKISKPTVRKRLKGLFDDGYIMIKKKGSSKVVNLTELGRRVLDV